MEDNSASISTIKASDYLRLLEIIDQLSKLLVEWKNSTQLSNESLDISTIDEIFEKLAINIKRISNAINVEKNAMLCITILNTIVRVCVMDRLSIVISRESFQSMFKELKTSSEYFILNLIEDSDFYPILLTDIFNSMLMNLVKDGLMETCFERLLSNGTLSNNVIHDSDLVRDTVSNDTDDNDTSIVDKKSVEDDQVDFSQIIIIYISYIGGLAFKTTIPSTNDFKNNYTSLMISIQTFINNYVTNVDNYVTLIPLDMILNLLGFLWDLTDKITVIPMFVDIGYVEKALQWIHTDVFGDQIEHLGTPIFSIIHNLSRDKKGLKKLLTEKAFDILIERMPLVNDKNAKELTEVFSMTLISLATNDEQSEKNKNIFFNVGETLYNGCKDAERDVNLRHDGLHLSECLELLHRSFSNTYVIKHILDNKNNENPTPIQYFSQLLLSFYGTLLDPEPDELEKRVAEYLLKVLLQISSYPDYIKELIENNEFCIIVECLARRPKQDDAKRIWCNIQQILSPKQSKKSASSGIYVSYDWADQEFCKEFIKALREKTSIPVWVDDENVELSNGTWEHTYSMINSAIVIIVLVSTAYAENTDKFQELSYIISTNDKSSDREKSLIVVEVEPEFTFNRRWMSDLLSTETRISYDNNIDKLAYKVYKEITIPKKSSIKCLPCRKRSVRKRRIEHADRSVDSEIEVLRSNVDIGNSQCATEINIQNQPLNTIDDSNVLISTRKHDPYPVTTCFTTPMGSDDSSTQV